MTASSLPVNQFLTKTNTFFFPKIFLLYMTFPQCRKKKLSGVKFCWFMISSFCKSWESLNCHDIPSTQADTLFFFFFFFFFLFVCFFCGGGGGARRWWGGLKPFQEYFTYQANLSSKVGENRRTLGKTAWPSINRTWLSDMRPEQGSNHNGELSYPPGYGGPQQMCYFPA